MEQSKKAHHYDTIILNSRAKPQPKDMDNDMALYQSRGTTEKGAFGQINHLNQTQTPETRRYGVARARAIEEDDKRNKNQKPTDKTTTNSGQPTGEHAIRATEGPLARMSHNQSRERASFPKTPPGRTLKRDQFHQ